MINKFVRGRTYVFIDAANILYSQRTLKWLISYEKLIRYFHKECATLGLCFVFIGKFKENNKQQKFFDMLEINNYIVKTKAIKNIKIKNNSTKNKADMDVEMSFEIFDQINNFDTAILLTGDSDFAFIVRRIKKLKKRVLVMSTRGHISIELIRLAKYIDFRKIRNEIELKKNLPGEPERSLGNKSPEVNHYNYHNIMKNIVKQKVFCSANVKK